MYFFGHVNDIDVGQDNPKSPCLSFFPRNTVFRVNSADLVLPIMSLSLDVWLMSFYNVLTAPLFTLGCVLMSIIFIRDFS